MTDRLAEYRAFIADKAIKERMGGFSARPINAQAKAHQIAVLEFAINKGRSAYF